MGLEDGIIRIVDAETFTTIGESLVGDNESIQLISFSPDGKYIIATDKHHVHMWDVESGNQIGQPLLECTGIVFYAAFSPDGRYILLALDKSIYLLDIQTGEKVKEYVDGHTDIITSASFSPNGRYIVSSALDNAICIWDISPSLQMEQIETGRTEINIDTIISHNRKYKAFSYHVDQTIHIVDAQTNELIRRPLEGHKFNITSIEFSPDDKYIIAASLDKTIHVWDVETSEQILCIVSDEVVYSTSFSEDGRKIIAYRKESTWVIDFPPLQELIDETRERFKDRELTPEEKRMYYLE